MNSITDLIGLVGQGDTLQRLSSFLDESPTATRRGVESALPLSMTGIASLFSGESKAGELLGALRSGSAPHVDAADFGRLVADPERADAFTQSGTGLLGRMFGGKLNSILDVLSGSSGLNRSSATTLLGLAGPLVLGAIHKLVQSKNLDARALSQWLSSEGRNASSMLPASFSGILVGGSGPELHRGRESQVERAFETHSYDTPSPDTQRVPAGDAPTTYESHRVTPAVPSYAPPAGNAINKRGRGFLWLAMALGGVLLFGLFRRSVTERDERAATREAVTREDRAERRPAEIQAAPEDRVEQPPAIQAAPEETATGTGSQAVTPQREMPPQQPAQAARPKPASEPGGAEEAQATRDEARATRDEAQATRDEAGAMSETQRADMRASADAERIEARADLAEAEAEEDARNAAGGGAATPQQYTVTFATGSDRPQAQGALEKAAKTLRADTHAKAILRGYADPRGDQAKNRELSEARAEAVKAYLVKKGIDENRIETDALGIESPRATHSPSRRVEISIER